MEITFASLFFSLVFLQLCLTSQSQLVPALHIFGDSAVEAGNNLYLNTSFRADFDPYGVDFFVGDTGRFSNGATITDVLATALDLRLPFPLVNGTNSTSFVYDDKSAFNYAYGSAGILPETGGTMGEKLSLGQQIGLFKQIVEIHLPQQFKSSEKVSQYISDSLFVVFIGSNDYIHNYLQSGSNSSSSQYNVEQFAEVLVKEYGHQVLELQALGAKKMVVFEIPPIGCYPVVLENVQPKTICAEDVNKMVSIFNDKLGKKVKELSSTSKDSTIILARTYDLVYDMINNSSAYGLEETAKPCCVVRNDGSGLCVPEKTPCEKRNTTLFWDQAHISQAASEKIALKVFNGSGVTSPANIVDAIKFGAKPKPATYAPLTSQAPTSEPPMSAHSGARPSSVSNFNFFLLLVLSVVLSYS